MGDMTSDGTYTYAYDEAARMKSATSTTNTITYQVNYIGQRISKTVNGVTTYFNYDENNQLIGEYDQNGNAVKEHIYLQGMPMGLISSGTLYYVHPDHLGSPRTITDSSNNVLWTWANDSPFGDNLPLETGISTYNLRFPGQYFDNETKLNYNLNRDYNSNTGRYVQTDPIGLNGGLNLYNYTGENPLIYADKNGQLFGLDTLVGGVIGAVAGGITNGLSYYSQGCRFWTGFKNGAIGGLVGGVVFTFNPFIAGASGSIITEALNRNQHVQSFDNIYLDFAMAGSIGGVTNWAGGAAGAALEAKYGEIWATNMGVLNGITYSNDINNWQNTGSILSGGTNCGCNKQ